MFNRKRSLVLAAAALFVLTAFPASAQFWGAPGSTGTVDEASTSLHEFHNATLRFKTGQTGTIVARYPLGNAAVENPDFNTLVFSYGGPGVSMKLMHVLQCSGIVEEQVSWGPSTATDANTCAEIDVSSVYWDTYGYSWYLEVTLTRSTTATNPQFHQAQMIP